MREVVAFALVMLCILAVFVIVHVLCNPMIKKEDLVPVPDEELYPFNDDSDYVPHINVLI